MDYPKKFVISYRNHPIPVYIVGDIQYLYFVAKHPAEGEIHLNLDLEKDGKMRWVEVNGHRSDRAVEIGKKILVQMKKEGYKLDCLSSTNGE